MNKAYDRVSWEFFLNMLRTMGFGQTWVNWVKQCITTVPFSVFVNGNHSLLQHAVFGKGVHSHPIYLYWWVRGFSYGLEEFAVNNICKGIALRSSQAQAEDVECGQVRVCLQMGHGSPT
ncbi:uncharacterized protein LOC131320214 isoform X2 [Rhododendron vialii]|uniref:uncharacterized protein LOC131320214 isoform X2 n=1 Tax=Rhododendron vialii TaxID=182163 RepID=UPI00265F8F08|nr:uncharacterized protein LOC131320214 isoform X2 [Rhododendron vialii]